MMTKIFLVFILGFGPFSQIDHQRSYGVPGVAMLNPYLTAQPQLAAQSFRIIDDQRLYGFPRNGLSVVNLVEQPAPLFAEASNGVDVIGLIGLQRQKEKPAGLVVWRTTTMLIV